MSERWRSGLTLALSAAILAGVVLAGPGDEMAAVRRLLGIGGDPLGEPADVAPGGEYAFLRHQPRDADAPVTWDPCREIRFEVNADGAPDGTEETVALVRSAVEEVSSVTGLQFDYLGLTDRRPAWKEEFLPAVSRAPVLVSWATAEEVDELAGDVAGVGGAVAAPSASSNRLRYVSGGVTLDSDAFDDLEDEPDGDAYQRAILLHELGHLVGLGHVDSPAELMYPDDVGHLGFRRGDLNGLVRLGQGECG